MSTPYQARAFDAPHITPENKPYFDAAAQDRLVLKRCDACNAPHHFPRTICPFCGSDRTAWVEASGRGTVYSVSVTRRGTPVAYAMAYVTLEEGVTMMTNIVECDLDAIGIGDSVVATFVAAKDGSKVPMFKPASTPGSTG